MLVLLWCLLCRCCCLFRGISCVLLVVLIVVVRVVCVLRYVVDFDFCACAVVYVDWLF